jgi:hypothetical protein
MTGRTTGPHTHFEIRLNGNNLAHNFSNFFKFFTTDPILQAWPFYRPLRFVYYSAIYSFFGGQAGVYHLASLLLHAINTILLFIFLKKIFNLQKFHFSQTLAFVLSLIFLVHPVNVETVVWISAAQDLLFICFLLLGLLLTDYYCRKKGPVIIAFLIHLLIFACLLCKETGVAAVIIIPAFCFLVYKKLNKTIISFAVIPSVIYVLMRFIWDPGALGIKSPFLPTQSASLITRLTTIPYEMASYVRLLLFPKDLFMFQQDIVSKITDPKFYLSLPVMLAVIAVIGWLFLKYKSRLLGFFLLWTALSFLVISNIYPVTATIAERWMYFSLIGLLGFFGLIVIRLAKCKKTIIICYLLTSCILATSTYGISSSILSELKNRRKGKIIYMKVQRGGDTSRKRFNFGN